MKKYYGRELDDVSEAGNLDAGVRDPEPQIFQSIERRIWFESVFSDKLWNSEL